MQSSFLTNYSEERFIDRLKKNIDSCRKFMFSVSFIKRAGLRLISSNLEAALARGAEGALITSTYQNFTDIDSLLWFHDLSLRYPDRFSCHLDRECFHDKTGNPVGFHSKGYLFEFSDHNELLIGSSNITVYALLKNVEWDVSVIDDMVSTDSVLTFEAARDEFSSLWAKTIPLSRDLIEEYKQHLFFAIERWDMDYEIANAQIKPNYMQRRALKELNRIRAMGASKSLITAAAGSGKTYLAAFDALNFNPDRLLYIVQEGSILMKSFETFQRVFGSDRSYGIYNKDYKEFDMDFVFSTNITMANSLELFDKHTFDYIIIDEAHHAAAESYRKILNYFEPEFLLGITATPERMDGEDVFALFDQNVPYELRLRDAIINGLVVPFKYYGIRDELIEYGISQTKGHRFVEQFSDEAHCEFIYQAIERHRLPGGVKLKALAFCRDISHAIRMSQAMEDYYHTRYLTGRNSVGERVRAYKDLQDDTADLEILFTVDILNEGVDITNVDMVMFLRPTESPVVFLQQLGRGLRKAPGKKYLNVLDFIGNYEKAGRVRFFLAGAGGNGTVGDPTGGADIPDECLIDFDMRLIDLFAEMDKKHRKIQDLVRDEYFRVKALIEHVPSRMDLFTDMEDEIYQLAISHAKDNPFRNYMGFLASLGELSADEQVVYDSLGREFINVIETTSMSKVYKMPVLMAFYNGGNVRMEVTEAQLLESWKKFFDDGTNWKDLDPKQTHEQYKAMTDQQHIRKIMQMPVHFLLESGKGFCGEKDGYALA